jgi:hypothetical protein
MGVAGLGVPNCEFHTGVEKRQKGGVEIYELRPKKRPEFTGKSC